jgi:type II secretory pathway component PulM
MKHWQDLSEREQYIIGGGVLIACCLFVYFFLWSPFLNHNFQLRQEINYQRSLLTWLQAAEIELKQLRSTNKVIHKVASSEVLTAIDQSLTQLKLRSFVSEMSQADSNKIRINFNSVPFDRLISWLKMCWQQYAMRIDQIDIEPDVHSGLVKAYVIFQV